MTAPVPCPTCRLPIDSVTRAGTPWRREVAIGLHGHPYDLMVETGDHSGTVTHADGSPPCPVLDVRPLFEALGVDR